MIIGITGGIATGKSYVGNYIKSLGYPVYSSDQIAKDLLKPGAVNYALVKEAFGDEILLDNQEIDKKKLAQIIFSDEMKRKQLMALTHPEIIAELKRLGTLHPLVFLEIPLLFESGLESMVDEIWLVYCPSVIQRQRLMDRDNISEEEAERRIKSQMPLGEKIAKCHWGIRTENDEKTIKEAVDQLLSRLEQQK